MKSWFDLADKTKTVLKICRGYFEKRYSEARRWTQNVTCLLRASISPRLMSDDYGLALRQKSTTSDIKNCNAQRGEQKQSRGSKNSVDSNITMSGSSFQDLSFLASIVTLFLVLCPQECIGKTHRPFRIGLDLALVHSHFTLCLNLHRSVN